MKVIPGYICNQIRQVITECRGVTATEYAIIAVVMSSAVLVTVDDDYVINAVVETITRISEKLGLDNN